MPSLTDPARELSDLIRALEISANVQSDVGMAQLFEVDAWSSEFFNIIFAISSRIDELKNLTDALALDQDQKDEIKRNLETMRQAFGPNGLRNPWSHTLGNYLSPAVTGHLSALSGLVRQQRAYPKLEEGETSDLLDMVAELQSWLVAHQLVEHDFIRQALIDGLGQMRFRLERIKWLGWGYTIDSLKEVIAAYLALERGTPADCSNTTAEAMVKQIAGFVRSFYEKARLSKEIVETGDFILRSYGAIQLLSCGRTTIAGLLTHAG